MPQVSNPTVSLVAGGAGFIGATLVADLLTREQVVVVVDNFSNGSRSNLHGLADHPRLHVIEAELSLRVECAQAFEAAARLGQVDEVWHLAANSNIPAGVHDPDIDLRDTFLTTFELLRAMRDFGVGKLQFASSSAIYGDLGNTLLEEHTGPLLPISNYGAMKLASEAQASAAAESHLSHVNLFRFPNVVGVPATHGVILDFMRKLRTSPGVLHVLGDGTQQKAYLHASDLVRAMLLIRDHSQPEKVGVYNVGPVDSGVTVRWIAERVVERAGPGAEIRFGLGNKGWVGDVPRFDYSTHKLQAFGWQPALGSQAAVLRAIDEIALQEGF